MLIFYQQQEEEQEAAAQKEKEKHVKSAVAMVVAEVALKARRQLERGEEEDNGAPIKRRRCSCSQHDRAKRAIQEDYFSPTPIFNDSPFERTFRITKSMVEDEILQICANADPFFTAVQDVTGQFAIVPVAKILMVLKQIAYGCCPAAFMDYFQMSETTERLCLIKFSRLVSSHEVLGSVYLRQMLHIY